MVERLGSIPYKYDYEGGGWQLKDSYRFQSVKEYLMVPVVVGFVFISFAWMIFWSSLPGKKTDMIGAYPFAIATGKFVVEPIMEEMPDG